jgi:phytoene/squalene synthetase
VPRDVHALCAFYRTVDDLSDEPPAGFCRQDILGVLCDWEGALRGTRAAETPLVVEVISLADRHVIPIEYLCMALEGAGFDLDLRVMQIESS